MSMRIEVTETEIIVTGYVGPLLTIVDPEARDVKLVDCTIEGAPAS